jgi:hypothetical protein
LVMLAFMVAFGIGQSNLFLVTAIEFVWLRFKQEPNRPLVEFGKSLAVWLHEAAGFLVSPQSRSRFRGRGGRGPNEFAFVGRRITFTPLRVSAFTVVTSCRAR